MAHMQTAGLHRSPNGHNVNVATLEFTAEGMDKVRAGAEAESELSTMQMTIEELIAEFLTPAEPRRMTKPVRAAYEGRRAAILNRFAELGIDPDDLREEV